MTAELQPPDAEANPDSKSDVPKETSLPVRRLAIALAVIIGGVLVIYATDLVPRARLAMLMGRLNASANRMDPTSAIASDADLNDLAGFSPRRLAAYFADRYPVQQRCLAYRGVARARSKRPTENCRTVPLSLTNAALRETDAKVLDLVLAAMGSFAMPFRDEGETVFAAANEGPTTMARLRVMGFLFDDCPDLHDRILNWIEARSKSEVWDDRIGAFALLAAHAPKDPLTTSVAHLLLAAPEGRVSRVYDALLAMKRSQPELLKHARDLAIVELMSSDSQRFDDALEFLRWFGDFRRYLLDAVRQTTGNLPRRLELIRALHTAPQLERSTMDTNAIKLRSIDGRPTKVTQPKPWPLSKGDSSYYFDLLFSPEVEIRNAMIPFMITELTYTGGDSPPRILVKDAVLFDPASRERLAPLLDNPGVTSDHLVLLFFLKYCQIRADEVPRFCAAIERNLVSTNTNPLQGYMSDNSLLAASIFDQLLANHPKHPKVVSLANRILEVDAQPNALAAAGRLVIASAADPTVAQRTIEAAFRRATGSSRVTMLEILESSLARAGGFQDKSVARSACQLKLEQLTGLLGRQHLPENWLYETDGILSYLDLTIVREEFAKYLSQAFAANQIVSRESFQNGIAPFKKQTALIGEIKPKVVAALSANNPSGRASALNALVAVGVTEKPIQDAIVAALNDGNAEVCEAAISAVAALGLLRADVLTKLAALASGPGDNDIRILALESLARLAPNDLQTAALVNRLANDESHAVQLRAQAIIRKTLAR